MFKQTVPATYGRVQVWRDSIESEDAISGHASSLRSSEGLVQHGRFHDEQTGLGQIEVMAQFIRSESWIDSSEDGASTNNAKIQDRVLKLCEGQQRKQRISTGRSYIIEAIDADAIARLDALGTQTGYKLAGLCGDLTQRERVRRG